MTDQSRLWLCPWCGETFRIPDGIDDPSICSKCRNQQQPAGHASLPTGRVSPPAIQGSDTPKHRSFRLTSAEGMTQSQTAITAVCAVVGSIVLIYLTSGKDDSHQSSSASRDSSPAVEAVATKPSTDTSADDPKPQVRKRPLTGEKGYVSLGKPGFVPVAGSGEYFDRSIKLSNAGDTMGIQQMLLAEQLILVESGTQILVIDLNFIGTEVRILSGKYQGRSGFVSNDFLFK